MARPFPTLRYPIVQAPMAGGPSTPALAAAVSNAGGFGFLAAGYKKASAVREDIAQLRSLTSQPFGLNLFVPGTPSRNAAELDTYLRRIRPDADALGVELGVPKFDDDDWAAKLDLVVEARIPVVSFVFGCPDRAVIDRLHRADVSVWITVTEPSEARLARDAGADAVIAQGIEAGGHRGSFTDEDGVGELGVLALVRLIAREGDLPIVAAGGIADGAGVAAVLAVGARAAQIGTAFMRCPEAGTVPVHRKALASPGRTALTRAFTGRRARGIENRFMREHSAAAPRAYPELHFATAPMRAKARADGDADRLHLWAGQAFALAEEIPAAELVKRWGDDASVRRTS